MFYLLYVKGHENLNPDDFQLTNGNDLYNYNISIRSKPSNGNNPNYTLDNREPIRNLDCANLCAFLLGVDSIQGTWSGNLNYKTIAVPLSINSC